MHYMMCKMNEEMPVTENQERQFRGYTSITFKLKKAYKRALRLIAADQGLTSSDLLQEAVEKIVHSYKDGFFYNYVARDEVQNGSEGAQ